MMFRRGASLTRRKPLLNIEEAKVQQRSIILSSSRSDSAGIGTVIDELDARSAVDLAARSKWLPRLHRAGPSASLDKSIVRIRLWRYDSIGWVGCQITRPRDWKYPSQLEMCPRAPARPLGAFQLQTANSIRRTRCVIGANQGLQIPVSI